MRVGSASEGGSLGTNPFLPEPRVLVGYVISNLAPPDPFHLLLAINSGRTTRCTRRARQESTDMTWAQDVGGAKRLRVMANAWVLCCGAEKAAAQPGSGGGVPHTHGETELRFVELGRGLLRA